MRVLFVGQDAGQLESTNHSLEGSKYTLVPTIGTEHAWQLLLAGDARCVILDADLIDSPSSEFVQRVRAADMPPVYFLILTSQRDGVFGGDDILRKPFKGDELLARLAIGQRMLWMGDSLSQVRDQLENQALYDAITGLMNFPAFCKLARGEIERARRSSTPFSLIVLEIENFEKFNAAYGVATGNELLKTVSQRIREKGRLYDCIGHWAGGEFVIALPGVNSPDAEKIAERIIAGILSAGFKIQGEAVDISVRGGIATAVQIGTEMDIQPLILSAQQALARARESGSDRVHLANS